MYNRMQDPDNNNSSSDREDFKRRISMPMSNPNPYATTPTTTTSATNIIEEEEEEEIPRTPWRSDTIGLGGYQAPSEQAELRYDSGRGTDF